MPTFASEALVLRTHKLGETSKIVVLLTRERGKVRAVAKGARGLRSRYRSALEPLSEVRAEFFERQGMDLMRLQACELLRSAFPTGPARLETAMTLSYAAELIDAFAPEGEAEDAVYRLALAIIKAAQQGVPQGPLCRYLEGWLLKLHGLYPSLDLCATCRGPLPEGDLNYHASAHGFVCRRCGTTAGQKLPAAARAFLQEAFRIAPGALTEQHVPGAAALEDFHRERIANHLERTLRSQRVLSDVAREVQG